MTYNHLADSTSPYLLQHAGNPVHWRQWGPEALAAAKAADKPILLSIGYAACHWCHVMAHESFENPDIAAVMNDLMINIKVDREERPDIDQIYMSALAMTGQPGGWPLTMFLTPDGRPFWGGTYFPPVPKYGRPGFADIVRTVADMYRQQPGKIAQNVEALTHALQDLARSRPVDDLDPAILDPVADKIASEFDPVHGGVTGAPKFPQASILTLLWHGARRTGSSRLADAVTLSVRRMAQGGIYDHLGGGFSRYSVDEKWLVPHFEKMLYDNAQLLDQLLWQWMSSGDPLFLRRMEETIAWLDREMRQPNGAFAASLDADSDGVEGKFYVWTREEIRATLKDAIDESAIALLEETYDITDGGNWEGVTILNRGLEDTLPNPADEARLRQPLDLLFAARSRRIRPGLDDKILADWNGLVIAALARCGAALDRPHWISLAATAFDAITQTMSQDGRLYHAWRNGQRHQPGMLTDYAAMMNAAIALFLATSDTRYIERAAAWAETVQRHFIDQDEGGYFLTPDDGDHLIVRPKSIHDNAEPSGNGNLLVALARLFHLTGDRLYADRADGIMRAFGGELSRNIFPLSTWLCGIDHLVNGEVIIILSGDDAAETGRLAAAARNSADPRRMVVVVNDSQDIPQNHPAAGKTLVDGRATAYRCQGLTCFPPVTDPSLLS